MTDIIVNGVRHSLDADPAMPLLWALRDLLGLHGTKFRLRYWRLRCVHHSP
jgi:isoquinoline 1-oxidoreductase alpha subunit